MSGPKPGTHTPNPRRRAVGLRLFASSIAVAAGTAALVIAILLLRGVLA